MTTPFVRPVTVGSVGMGALYFFTSHMVIRSMFYVGTGHSRMEIAVFLLIALGSVALAHVLAVPLLRFRLLASEYVNVPAVSLLALLGALLGLTSILPVTGIVPFYLSALLTGLACGWLVVIWMSSFHVTSPDPPTFSLSPDLLCAVGFYFCFRFVSEVSRGVSDGFLMALPLVAVACILAETNDAGRAGDERFESVRESRRASLVLVCVSASFALITPLVVHLSDKDDLYLSGGLNYMVLFEVLVVALIMLCCYVLHWLSSQRVRPRFVGTFVGIMLCVPTFAIGLAMGATWRPDGVANLMWETSLWVMLVAVFAYDLRYTLYLAQGLSVGLMFEAMCVGQMTMQLVRHVGAGTWVCPVAIVLSVAYLAGVFVQLFRGSGAHRGDLSADASAMRSLAGDAGTDADDAHARVACGTCGAGEDPVGESPAAGMVADRRCAELGARFFLTESEVRILAYVSQGRSARYISEELGVSFNTVRTHIRHVYEKIGIHSRQELIDLVSVVGVGAEVD